MKKSELRKLVEEYKTLNQKSEKNPPNSDKISNRIKEIKHRYYHETGADLLEQLNLENKNNPIKNVPKQRHLR